MTRITDYASLPVAALADVLPIVDVDDSTMSPAGTTKQITVADFIGMLGAALNYGADPTGATDSSAAINSALANGLAYLSEGTYLMNGATALALSSPGSRLTGAGYGLTTIKIGSSFSGSEVVSVAAPNCMVDNLSIIGASSTIASNPACNGIEIQPGSFQYTISNVFTQYVNGYSLEGTNATGHDDISHSVVDKFWSYNCAGSIHYDGDLGSGAQSTVGVTLSNISIGGGGTASGTNANLDAILIEAAGDLVFSNCLIGIGSAGTGNCIHIVGDCSAVYFNGFDAGGYPGTLAGSQCGVRIENDVNGLNAQRIRFSNGVFQTFGQGAAISGLAQQVSFNGVSFVSNNTHGVTLSGTGSQINFSDCSWSGNGAGASGTNYDLNNSGGATGTVRNCDFLTALTTTGTAGVQAVVAISSGVALNFETCQFLGTGAGHSNIFTNFPHTVRGCKNLNPWGATTDAGTPTSGSGSNALHYDAQFYITAANTPYSFTATHASPCVFTASGSSYANGNPVVLTGASLPAGFTAGTTYYVVSASGTTFELAATSGGSAINSTSTGSGTVAGVCLILRNTQGNGGGVGPTVTIPPGGVLAVFVRAAASITPTFAADSAPAWVIDGM